MYHIVSPLGPRKQYLSLRFLICKVEIKTPDSKVVRIKGNNGGNLPGTWPSPKKKGDSLHSYEDSRELVEGSGALVSACARVCTYTRPKGTKVGFLSFGTLDMLDQTIVCCGADLYVAGRLAACWPLPTRCQ